jgi:TPR repeat protein
MEMDAVALIELNRLAVGKGSVEAMYNLGVVNYAGFGLPENKVVAAEWWRKAAERGDADAQYNLGIMYGIGDGVKFDGEMSAMWLRKAAEQGHADAQLKLGHEDAVPPTKGRKAVAPKAPKAPKAKAQTPKVKPEPQ